MRIITIVRTLNEEKNIARFCLGYRWVDKIIVADGGSMDDTVSIANSFRNVEVHPFHQYIEGKEGLKRNPHGKHINYMINLAKEDGADWIIFDDCDCVPTEDLRLNAKTFFDTCEVYGHKAIFLYRLYIYHDNQYFPDMNKPGQSLWAWKANTKLKADETNPWQHMILNIPNERYNLEKPFCCLHYFCPDEETIQRKIEFYRRIAEIPEIVHPLRTGGVLETLPEWAHI